jgi:hypothetical protein
MNARSVRPLLLVLLGLGLAGCSTTEQFTVEFPTIVGKRVIYTADSNANVAGAFGDEVWVADTGSLSFTVTRIDAGITAPAYADAPFTLTTLGPMGYRVVEDPTDGCPSHYNLMPRLGGAISTFFSGQCVLGIGTNATYDRIVVMATVGTSGTNIYIGDPVNLSTVFQLNVGNTATPGTVTQFAIAPNADVLVWTDADGIHSADLGQVPDAIMGTLLNADQPSQLFLTSNGVSVVYTPVGDERYWVQPVAGGAATPLTNVLAGGDLLDRTADGARLNSTGSALLYAATIGGVDQLWGVTLASPLGEARTDAAASQLLQAGASFEFSPDGGSYAWIGDDGTGHAVFSATVNAPTNVLTLTPATEEPTGAVHWTDGSTIAYVSTDADFVTPIGASALRTVNTGTPLTTTLMGADESAGFFVGDVATCSDGTLAYGLSDFVFGTWVAAVYTANPQAAASEQRISPEIAALAPEIHAIACVD